MFWTASWDRKSKRERARDTGGKFGRKGKWLWRWIWGPAHLKYNLLSKEMSSLMPLPFLGHVGSQSSQCLLGSSPWRGFAVDHRSVVPFPDVLITPNSILYRKHDIYQTEVFPVGWELDISAQFLPQVHERVKLFAVEITGRCLLPPCFPRWNSTCTCVPAHSCTHKHVHTPSNTISFWNLACLHKYNLFI